MLTDSEKAAVEAWLSELPPPTDPGSALLPVPGQSANTDPAAESPDPFSSPAVSAAEKKRRPKPDTLKRQALKRFGNLDNIHFYSSNACWLKIDRNGERHSHIYHYDDWSSPMQAIQAAINRRDRIKLTCPLEPKPLIRPMTARRSNTGVTGVRYSFRQKQRKQTEVLLFELQAYFKTAEGRYRHKKFERKADKLEHAQIADLVKKAIGFRSAYERSVNAGERFDPTADVDWAQYAAADPERYDALADKIVKQIRAHLDAKPETLV